MVLNPYMSESQTPVSSVITTRMTWDVSYQEFKIPQGILQIFLPKKTDCCVVVVEIPVVKNDLRILDKLLTKKNLKALVLCDPRSRTRSLIISKTYILFTATNHYILHTWHKWEICHFFPKLIVFRDAEPQKRKSGRCFRFLAQT